MPSPGNEIGFGDVPGAYFYPSSGLSRFAFWTIQGYVPPSTSRTPNLYLGSEDTALAPEWISQPTIAHPGEAVNAPLPAGPPSDSGKVYFAYQGALLPEDEPRRAIEEEPGAIPAGGNAWGFYEWNNGSLAAVDKSDGTLDPYGAVPAATGRRAKETNTDAHANQVSADGSRAFFVSPDPLAPHPSSDPAELYLRENGKSVLVSRDELAGGAPSPGYEEATGLSEQGPHTIVTGITAAVQPTVFLKAAEARTDYVYATSAGTVAFFESANKLASSAGGEVPTGPGPWIYRFDAATGRVTWVPGVVGPIVASSSDGSSVAFVEYGEHVVADPASGKLYLANGNTVVKVAELPAPPNEKSGTPNVVLTSARVSKSGGFLVFETSSTVPGALNASGTAPANNSSGFDEVYRYEAATSKLLCISCATPGTTVVANSNLSNDNQQESEENASATGWAVPSRGMTSDGAKVFFDTTQALVAADTNSVRDAYQWEDGKVFLLSSGTGVAPSFFLDNSESGTDVFIATADNLVAADTDGVYDVYDVREGGGFHLGMTPAPCVDGCSDAAPTGPEPSTSGPLSASFVGPGNLAVPATSPPVRRQTAAQVRAERLAHALKACRKAPSRGHRVACERSARRRYGVGKHR